MTTTGLLGYTVDVNHVHDMNTLYEKNEPDDEIYKALGVITEVISGLIKKTRHSSWKMWQ